MSKPVYVNETEIFDKYKARLLDYKVNAPSIKNTYLSQENSIIPVKLNESVGIRKVDIELEFRGDSCNESLVNISNLTADLLYENEIRLPDGFFYFGILDKVSAPKLKGDTFYSVKFTIAAYRHGELQSHEFTETGAIDVLGHIKAPAVITISNATGTVTVNDITVKDITGTVVIDGYKKTVFETEGVVTKNKFKDCELTKFPVLEPGVNMINITGAATVTIEYKPIYL